MKTNLMITIAKLLWLTFHYFWYSSFLLAAFLEVSSSSPSCEENTGCKTEELNCTIGTLCQYKISQHKCEFEISNVTGGHGYPEWLVYNKQEKTLRGVPSDQDKNSKILFIGENKKHSNKCSSVVLKIKLCPLGNLFLKDKCDRNSKNIEHCGENKRLVFAALVFDVTFYNLSSKQRVSFVEKLHKHDKKAGTDQTFTLLLANNTSNHPFISFLDNTTRHTDATFLPGTAKQPYTLLTWLAGCGDIKDMNDKPLQQLKKISKDFNKTGYKVIQWYTITGLTKRENIEIEKTTEVSLTTTKIKNKTSTSTHSLTKEALSSFSSSAINTISLISMRTKRSKDNNKEKKNSSISSGRKPSVSHNIHIVGFCPKEEVATSWGVFLWHKTKVYKQATVKCPCNLVVKITRKCLFRESNQTVFWDLFDPTQCSCSGTSLGIYSLSEQRLNSSNVVPVSENLYKLTFPGWKLSPGEISFTAKALENIIAVNDTANQTFIHVLKTIDNILDADSDIIRESQQDSSSSTRVLKLFPQFLEKLNVTEQVPFTSQLRNFVVDIIVVGPNSKGGVIYTGTMNERVFSNISGNDVATNISVSKATIFLPEILFHESSTQNISKTVIFTLFRTSKLFQHSPNSERLDSYVIAGNIKEQVVSNSSEPIVLSYVSLTEKIVDQASCVFWNTNKNDWDEEGCSFQGLIQDGRVICHCNHLTNFAMLLDVDINRSETLHDKILSIISYVGCCLSFLALSFTIMTILYFRDLRKKVPNKILVNFCISLASTLLIFLCASERSKLPAQSMNVCRVAAMALHYFVLATFMWMAVEAFNMYLSFVQVLRVHYSHFVLKSCIIAWGTPAIIVVITSAVSFQNYGHQKYCRLHGLPFFVSFLAPIVLILVGNTITFIVIIHALVSSQNHIQTDEKKRRFKLVRQAIAILVLLGLTWVFGLLAIDGARLLFQYLFCIFNSLQGIFVFVLNCVVPAKTRAKYRAMFGLENAVSVVESSKDKTTAKGKRDTTGTGTSAKEIARHVN